jgi:hypothetical protein
MMRKKEQTYGKLRRGNQTIRSIPRCITCCDSGFTTKETQKDDGWRFRKRGAQVSVLSVLKYSTGFYRAFKEDQEELSCSHLFYIPSFYISESLVISPHLMNCP